jgi:hypothetical protein
LSAAGSSSGDVEKVVTIIEVWTELLSKLCDAAASLKLDRKYVLLQLVMDIMDAMQPVSSPPTLQVVRIISDDLIHGVIKQKDLREFFKCLYKLSPIDPSGHAQLVQKLERHFIDVTSHDLCLDIFVKEADHLSPEVSDLFFVKAVEAFGNQKASGWITKMKNFFLGGSDDSRAKSQNLARLFSHCIRETKIDDLTAAAAFPVISSLPALANMMTFLPQLRNLGLLRADIDQKAELILRHVKQVSVLLAQGRLSLQLLVLLRDEQRVDRFSTLVCFEDPHVTSRELKACINLRLGELAQFHLAADDIRKFAAKFDDFKDKECVNEILAQFDRDQSRVELRDVCKVRDRTGPITLQLQHVSTKDLLQVRRHNELYSSAVFRIIADRVILEGTTR